MSSNKTVIAVDAMGGDLGPSVVVPGAIEAARQTGAKILLVGNEAAHAAARELHIRADRKSTRLNSSH